MGKNIKLIYSLLILFIVFSSCTKKVESVNPSSFQDALNASAGKTVTFYGWGGNPSVNKWLDETVAPALKQNYDITFKRVPMDINEILNKLTTEKQAGVTQGDIDVIWINGENFYTAKENGLLYGPITKKIGNYSKYIDEESADANLDFGHAINGMEVPFGKAQLVFIADKAKVAGFPTSAEGLLELAKANRGKLTYPAPPDFVGSAFIRNILYEIVGFDAIYHAKADPEELFKIAKPAFDYLNELEGYLWQEGKTYPKDSSILDKMFSDGQILMTMSYTPLYAAQKIKTGEFPETSDTFVFDKGNIGNTHYLAIPYNSSAKDAALVLIHHMISVEVQASKYDIRNWGDLPVLDFIKLNQGEKALFANMDNGLGILSPDELMQKRQPEIQAEKIAILEKLWYEKVLKE